MLSTDTCASRRHDPSTRAYRVTSDSSKHPSRAFHALTATVHKSGLTVIQLYAFGSPRRRVLVAVPAWIDSVERLADL